MFNLSGSELVFLLVIALVVLGPEKLPEAIRRFGKTYGEFKKVTSGFQSELRSALDEPMREMRETADAMRKVATFDFDTAAADGDSAANGPVVAAPRAADPVVQTPPAPPAPHPAAADEEVPAPASRPVPVTEAAETHG